jgi:hypothetical protein
MRRLVIAGLVYLTGIAIVLVIKPTLLFQEDGRWKEFGIGRDPAYYTFLPFWLFTIVWSVISYVLVMLIEDSFYTGEYDEIQEPVQYRRPNIRNRNSQGPAVTRELAPGYYMLNEGSTGRNGIPRYVYLGPEGVRPSDE